MWATGLREYLANGEGKAAEQGHDQHGLAKPWSIDMWSYEASENETDEHARYEPSE